MAKSWSALNSAFEKTSFLRVSYFWRAGPQKLQLFAVLTRRRNFKKSLRTIAALPWGYNPSTFHHVSRQYPRCPTKKNKKMPFLPFLAPFSIKWLGHRGYQRENWWNQLILQSHCRTEILRKLFLIAYGLRYSRVSAGLSSLSRKNRSIFRVQIWELRGKIMPSKTR